MGKMGNYTSGVTYKTKGHPSLGELAFCSLAIGITS